MSRASGSRNVEPTPEEVALLKRRGTIVEQAAEGFIEEKERILQHKEEEASKTLSQRLTEFKNQFYDSETKKFLERDGKGWFQLSLFYFIFYAILSSSFIGLLAVFAQTVDRVVPRYYDQSSVMAYTGQVNPSLGYRPQYDPESSFIRINLSEPKHWQEEYIHTLETFLERYENLKDEDVNIAPERQDRIVRFDYNEIINGTGCSREKKFGLADGKPCVVLKMNRIFGWRPQPYSEPPEQFNVDVPTSVKTGNKTNYLDRYVYVNCQGRDAIDKDNIGKISYHSLFPSTQIGGLPAKYYPYRNQKNYLSPLVFIQFESLNRNVLLNVECKLYARNIDNTDRRNQCGMVKFEIFVTA